MIRLCLLLHLLLALATAAYGHAATASSTASASLRAGVAQAGENRPSPDEVPAGHAASPGQGHPKARASVPSWDELAHIHHFHRHRLKKLKRHYRPSVWLSKWLLLVTHAAVLFISYLHVTPH